MTETPLADPRPSVVEQSGDFLIRGGRCVACHHPSVRMVRRCPRCGASVQADTFGPAGVVWASTRVHVPTPQRPEPFTLAYVDLESGPRLLAHVTSDTALSVGTRVRLTSPSAEGDPRVEVRA